MKIIPKLLALFLLVVFTQACAPYKTTPPAPRVTLSLHFKPDAYGRLAVIVIDQTRKFWHSGALRQVEDEFMRMVIEKGYILVSRSDVDRIIKELNFQRSSLTEQQVARIGHLLNVPAVLLASVNHISTRRYRPLIYVKGQSYYSTTVNISARLISAEKGEVLWISGYTGRYVVTDPSNDKEAQALAPVARVVATGLPGRYKRY